MSTSLDDSLINRAAPPGSMRYFALLYTPADKRDEVTALFVIDAEIRESAQSTNHDVAHTRLQWWRLEVDRLVNGNAQHPATRTLSSVTSDRRHFGKLHELIVAADMDLARMTYVNDRELAAYCARSGGAVAELIAIQLARPEPLDDVARAAANRLGALVRAAEVIRDTRQDAYEGRIYLPLDTLEKRRVSEVDLRAKEFSADARAALADTAMRIGDDLEQTLGSTPAHVRAHLRPLYVLAGLHAELLHQIARSNYQVGHVRVELGPIRKPWIAWRSARRAG